MSLLEDAKKIKTRKNNTSKQTEERIEVSLAWLKGEVTTSQVAKVLGYNSSSYNVLYSVAIDVRELYRRGELTLTTKEEE